MRKLYRGIFVRFKNLRKKKVKNDEELLIEKEWKEEEKERKKVFKKEYFWLFLFEKIEFSFILFGSFLFFIDPFIRDYNIILYGCARIIEGGVIGLSISSYLINKKLHKEKFFLKKELMNFFDKLFDKLLQRKHNNFMKEQMIGHILTSMGGKKVD